MFVPAEPALSHHPRNLSYILSPAAAPNICDAHPKGEKGSSLLLRGRSRVQRNLAIFLARSPSQAGAQVFGLSAPILLLWGGRGRWDLRDDQPGAPTWGLGLLGICRSTPRRPHTLVHTKGRGESPCLLASLFAFLFLVSWGLCVYVCVCVCVLKQEALRSPSLHFTDEETETQNGTRTWPKSPSECEGFVPSA